MQSVLFNLAKARWFRSFLLDFPHKCVIYIESDNWSRKIKIELKLTDGSGSSYIFFGGGTLFQKNFQQIFKKNSKNFQKYSKNFQKILTNIQKKYSKIFKKILENFKKFY